MMQNNSLIRLRPELGVLSRKVHPKQPPPKVPYRLVSGHPGLSTNVAHSAHLCASTSGHGLGSTLCSFLHTWQFGSCWACSGQGFKQSIRSFQGQYIGAGRLKGSDGGGIQDFQQIICIIAVTMVTGQ
jgi:hypothetical protein